MILKKNGDYSMETVFILIIPKILKEEGFIHRSRKCGKKNFKFEVDAIRIIMSCYK